LGQLLELLLPKQPRASSVGAAVGAVTTGSIEDITRRIAEAGMKQGLDPQERSASALEEIQGGVAALVGLVQGIAAAMPAPRAAGGAAAGAVSGLAGGVIGSLPRWNIRIGGLGL
jgi:hypothetical protein